METFMYENEDLEEDVMADGQPGQLQQDQGYMAMFLCVCTRQAAAFCADCSFEMSQSGNPARTLLQ